MCGDAESAERDKTDLSVKIKEKPSKWICQTLRD